MYSLGGKKREKSGNEAIGEGPSLSFCCSFSVDVHGAASLLLKALFFSVGNLGCGMDECGKRGEEVGESW